jgi:hypothetical protein
MLDCIRKGAVTNPYREGRNISWSARGAIAFRPDHSQEIFGVFFGMILVKGGEPKEYKEARSNQEQKRKHV